MARPMPRDPPVTTATLPVRSCSAANEVIRRCCHAGRELSSTVTRRRFVPSTGARRPEGRMNELTPTWHAQHTPEAPALVMADSGETVTYAELDDRSRRMAGALRARGVGAGDHIAILMENNRPLL